MNGKDVPGLDILPINEIKKAILENFSDWQINGDNPLDLEKDGAYFEVGAGDYYIRTDL